MRSTYTQKTITNRAYSGNVSNLKEVKLQKLNKNLPDNLKFIETMDNPYKFIPVTEITYRPTYDQS